MNGPLASLYKPPPPPPEPRPQKPLFEDKASMRARLVGLIHVNKTQQTIIDDLRRQLDKHRGMLADTRRMLDDARRMMDDMRSQDAKLLAQFNELSETQSSKAASAPSCHLETPVPAAAEQSAQQSPKVSE